MIYCGTPILQGIILAIGAMSFGYYTGTFSIIYDEETYFLHIEKVWLYKILVVLPSLFYTIFFIILIFFMSIKLRIFTFIFSVLGALFWGLMLVDYQTIWRYVCPAIIGCAELILFNIISYYITDIAPKGHIRVFSCILCLGFTSGQLLAELILYRFDRGDIAIIGCTICILESIFIWFVDEPNKFDTTDFCHRPNRNINPEAIAMVKKLQAKFVYTAGGMILSLYLVNSVVPRDVLIKNNLPELYVKYDYIIAGTMMFFGNLISSFINDIISTKFIWCTSTGCIAILQLLCFFSSIFKWGKITSIATQFCTHFFYGFGVLPVLLSYSLRLFDYPDRGATVYSFNGIFVLTFTNYKLFSSYKIQTMGYYTFLMCAILSTLYFCYGIFFVKEPFDIDCWSNEEKNNSSIPNPDNTHSDSRTDSNLHDPEQDSNHNATEQDDNHNATEQDNNPNVTEQDDNPNVTDNNIDEDENNLTVCV